MNKPLAQSVVSEGKVMDSGSLTGAQALVRMLLEYHVDVIFGVPGDTSLAFYEAIYDTDGRLRHVLARDERSATFMADAYARLAHRPGFCECPSGAGALSLSRLSTTLARSAKTRVPGGRPPLSRVRSPLPVRTR